MSFEPRLPRDDVNVSRSHPLAEAGWLVFAAVVAGFALALFAFALTEVVARWLPPQAEVRLFGGMWDAMAQPAEAADEKETRARALLARLASHWPESPYRFQLVVAPDDSMNAFALPGGTIAVTRGLLDATESENELAFVLAHEIGHFAHRDHLRAIGRGLVLSLLLRGIAGMGPGDAAVPELASDLASRGFARDQERDADAFALDLVYAEYGHVRGADAFFQRLPDAHAGLGRRAAAWLSTHPVTQARIDALHERAKERGYARNGDGPRMFNNSTQGEKK